MTKQDLETSLIKELAMPSLRKLTNFDFTSFGIAKASRTDELRNNDGRGFILTC